MGELSALPHAPSWAGGCLPPTPFPGLSTYSFPLWPDRFFYRCYGPATTITVLHLQIGFFICKFRTVSCRILPNFTLRYCILFPCVLHHQSYMYIPPITFSIEKFLIYQKIDLFIICIFHEMQPFTKIKTNKLISTTHNNCI